MALAALGVRLTAVPMNPRLDLAEILRHLHQAGMLSVLLEAGPALNGAFLKQHLVDRAVLFYAENRAWGQRRFPLPKASPVRSLLKSRCLTLRRSALEPMSVSPVYSTIPGPRWPISAKLEVCLPVSSKRQVPSSRSRRRAHPAGPTRITVSAPTLTPKLDTGDSIAVSGVCLTALDISHTHFSADLAQETVQRTTLARLVPGSLVNLELPTPAGSPLGGHVVQGHVDGVATLLTIDPLDTEDEETTDWRLRFAIPSELARYVVPQGSITVEGISLTVADLTGNIISIAIIPHTYAATALHALLPGAELNIEVDVLAKYAERQAQARAQDQATPADPAFTLLRPRLLNQKRPTSRGPRPKITCSPTVTRQGLSVAEATSSTRA